MLEETLIHEASHTSLDGRIKNTPEWLAAQEADNKFISQYAMDYPNREDIAETFVAWFATRYRQETFSAEQLADLECYVGNRFAFFDQYACQPGMMSPWADC